MFCDGGLELEICGAVYALSMYKHIRNETLVCERDPASGGLRWSQPRSLVCKPDCSSVAPPMIADEKSVYVAEGSLSGKGPGMVMVVVVVWGGLDNKCCSLRSRMVQPCLGGALHYCDMKRSMLPAASMFTYQCPILKDGKSVQATAQISCEVR